MSGTYVVNNELTEKAVLDTDLIKKCTFTVGTASPIRINGEQQDNQRTGPKRTNYQKFIEISYPGGDKSASCILPGCVMHHTISDYYGKPSIFIGVPQALVAQLKLKLSTTGSNPIFSEKRILSDSTYWWFRASFVDAEEGKEYIRTVADDGGEDYWGSYQDLFTEFPTSMLANITGSLKLKADTAENEPLTGKEEWRAGFQVSMFTPYDAIEVTAPSTGVSQRSVAGKRDTMKSGLKNAQKKATNGGK